MAINKALVKQTPEIIDFSLIPSDAGNLFFADVNGKLPFAIKRIYYIVDVPAKIERGSHAHKILDQVVIAMTGSFTIDVTNGVDNWSYVLNNPGQALYLPGGLWRTLRDFSSSSVCLVLASESYEADDYIRDYDEYIAWKSTQ